MIYSELARAIEYEASYHLWCALPHDDPAWSERIGHPPVCDVVDCPVFAEDEKGRTTMSILGRGTWVYYREYEQEMAARSLRFQKIANATPIGAMKGQKVKWTRYGEKP
jgi:hypothetical protein